jgi:hypothetical protein
VMSMPTTVSSCTTTFNGLLIRNCRPAIMQDCKRIHVSMFTRARTSVLSTTCFGPPNARVLANGTYEPIDPAD